MHWNEVINLVSIVEGTNDNGYPIEIERTSENIFANKKSVRSSEFHQAAANNIALQAVFEVYTFELIEGSKYVLHNEKEYEIVRIYDNGEKTELVCTIGSRMKQTKMG